MKNELLIDKNKYIDSELYNKLKFHCKKFLTKKNVYKVNMDYWIDDVIQEGFVQYLTNVKEETIKELHSRKNPKDAVGRYVRGICLINLIDKRKPFSKEIHNYNLIFKQLGDFIIEEFNINNEIDTTTIELFKEVYENELDYFDKILFDEYIKNKRNISKTSIEVKIPRKRLKKYIDAIIKDINEKIDIKIMKEIENLKNDDNIC